MRIVISIVALVVVLAAVLYYTPGSGPMPKIGYAEGLNNMKRPYHGKFWPSRSGEKVVAALDTLVSDLIAKGEKASEEEKLACFSRADAALKEIYRNKCPIEQSEVEILQSSGFMIALAAGLDGFRRVDSNPFTVIRE